jgi:hypothetical protein
MQNLNRNIIRAITLLLALQLMNLSIYAQEFTPIFNEYGSDEININETIVEYVVEVVMGHKNAIPEQQPQHKDLHFHKHACCFKIISVSASDNLLAETNHHFTTPIPPAELFIDRYQGEIRPQPPKLG